MLEALETAPLSKAARAAILKPGGGTFAFGQVRLVRTRGGKVRVVVRPTTRGKRLLRRTRGKLFVTLIVRFTPQGGTARTIIRRHVRVR